MNQGRPARRSGVKAVLRAGLTLLATIALLFHPGVASAQALDVVHAFAGGSTEPLLPVAGLIVGTDGNFYGTSSAGGANGFGTVFKMTPAGVVTVLFSFKGVEGGGAPMAELGQTGDGLLYGQTSGLGVASVFFRANPDGGADTFGPIAVTQPPHLPALIKASDGRLYGPYIQTFVCFMRVVAAGGLNGVVRLPDSVCVFGTRLSTLAPAAGGDLYGTSSRGGAFGKGLVFRWNSNLAVGILHEFTGGLEGDTPRSIVVGTDGNFYGTTESGGTFDKGTIFRMMPDGTTTVLYSFTGGADGRAPSWPLMQAIDGDFYGTAPGGAFNQGVAFKLTSAGVFTVLHAFNDGPTDGAQPQSRLLQTADGTFYGTTTGGGISRVGTVFTMTPSGAVTVLYSFGARVDGATSRAALLQASDGNFYGTTVAGGVGGQGTVFQMTPAGQTRMVHVFAGGSTDGAAPVSGVTQGSDGNFYGTTPSGGIFGTVFKLTPTGGFTLLHAFAGGSADGALPQAALVDVGDGSFLGTTTIGGFFGLGTAFRITPSGTFSIVHDFGGVFPGNTDAAQPRAALIKASDGQFYGTTIQGGTFNRGTVFRMTAAGSVTVLYAFTGGSSDGGTPLGSLVQASDGNLYGTTSANGAFSRGTVFRVTLSGSFTTLHAFQPNSEGGTPLAGLVQASDGLLYGTTSIGGAFNTGTVFRTTLDGAFSVVAAPAGAEGVGPGALIQATDGYLYGTTLSGGAFGNGVAFRLAPYAQPAPPSALIVATGNGLIRLTWTSVATAASYTVRRVAIGGSATVVASGLTALTFVDTAVANGQIYRYVVSAVNGSGEGLGSYEVSMTAGRIPVGDFNGDGRAEATVFRRANGTWYVRGVSITAWGGGPDIPVPGDYDGDSRTDIAVYRPTTGAWYIRNVGIVSWGGGADIPVPADYDGDRITDVAVFRPSTGEWFILQSTTHTGRVVVWGGGADVPVARDYDGDQKADVTVYRPSTGTWYVLRSSTATGSVTAWGGGADVPVAADYDGDGKADLAVFRPSTGAWYILQSSTATGRVATWGGGADIPVAADFDGDGKTDIAVFRPSTGEWFVIQSSTTTGTLFTFGAPGDIPVLGRP